MKGSRRKTQADASMKEQNAAQRARGAYIATMTQPQSLFDLSFAAQVNSPEVEHFRMLNKRLKWQIENKAMGLTFVLLDLDSTQLVSFTDSSFANNADLTSQIGYFLVIVDEDNNANIIHYSSIKCRRVTRSVLASELYAMANGFDTSATIKSSLTAILGSEIPIQLEKGLMIDLVSIRQAYERREVTEIKRIDGSANPADALTKSKGNRSLENVISTNKIRTEAIRLVERPLGGEGKGGD
ncbi:hypothetical protein EAF00_007329 [Botryotinia globosa]|nr:hypothetical protein EAF00_007329 [Botryotinia globosa]